MPQDGLVTVSSRYPARDTMERLLLALAKRNMTVFARVDHAAGAASAGLSLRPTEEPLSGARHHRIAWSQRITPSAA